MADAKPKAEASSKKGMGPAADQAVAATKQRLADEKKHAELGPASPGKVWVLMLKTALIGGLVYYADDKIQIGEGHVETLVKRGQAKVIKK